jgi:hypothetical protein
MSRPSLRPKNVAGRLIGVVGSFLLLLAIRSELALARQAATQERQIVVLHQDVGPVIDDAENRRFHLIDAPGTILAARIYQLRPGKKFSVHVLGTFEGQDYLATRTIGLMEKQALEARIALMLNTDVEGDLKPVISMRLPDDLGAGQMAVLTLLDRTELNGHVARVTPDTVVFETAGGLLVQVPEEKVLSLEWPEGMIRGGEFMRYDPNSTRLFFAPTGRGLRQGEGYFADYVLFFPTVALGVSNYFAMSGGISLVPGANTQIAYLAPKISLHSDDKVSAAAGVLFAFDLGGEGSIGIGYGVLTFGSPASAITLGAGIPFGEDVGNSPLLLIGGETQVSGHAKLITENWIFTGEDNLLLFSGGVRFFGRKLAVDLALVSSPEFFEEEGFPFFPWVDFSVVFGR